MIIEYKSKLISNLKQANIEADVISYEISRSDMELLSHKLDLQANDIKRVLLYQEGEPFDLVIDNPQEGKIIQGGVKEGRYFLNQYLVKKGLQDFLFMLLSTTE